MPGMIRTRLSSGVGLLVSTLVACGGGGYSDEARGDGSSGPSAAIDPSLVSDDPIGTNAACVTAMRSASLPPVNLVMMIDKSGSMGNPAEGGDPTVKWMPVNAGLKSFFGDARSAGYNASLQFFPAPGDVAATCAAPGWAAGVRPPLSMAGSTSPRKTTSRLPRPPAS